MDDSNFHYHCFSTLSSRISENFPEEPLKNTTDSQSMTSVSCDGTHVVEKCSEPSSSTPSASTSTKAKMNSMDLQKIKSEVSAIRKRLLRLKIEPIKRKKRTHTKFMARLASHHRHCCGDFSDVPDDSKKFCFHESSMLELYDQCSRSLKAIEKNRHEICEVLKRKETVDFESKKLIEEKTRQLGNLFENYQQVLREKDDYQNLCEELTAKVEQLQMEDKTNEELNEELDKKQEIIEELSDHITQLREHICECDKITEEKESLEEQYNKLQLQNKVLLCKLKKAREVPDKCKELEVKHKRLMDMQKRIVAHTTRLRNAVKIKNGMIDELRNACEVKDEMLRKHKCDLVQIYKASDNNNNNSATPDDSEPETFSGSCFTLSKELESLINSLYEEIDRSTVKSRLAEEQFELNFHLQRELASKETELAVLRSELQSLRGDMAAAEHYYEYESARVLSSPYESEQCCECCSSVQCCWVKKDYTFGI